MASRGITEQQVFDAADAVLVAGERPTIERVRRELGSGSPNTVNRYLELWWKRIAAQLNSGKSAIASRPEAVETAFQSVWRLALSAADAALVERTQSERQALMQEAAALAAEKGRLQTTQQALEQAKSLLDGQMKALRDELASVRRLSEERETARLAAVKGLAEAEKEGARLSAKLEAAIAREAGNQKHVAERVAAKDAEHEREIRRVRAEAERLREAGKSDRSAIAKLEHALATSQGELSAVRRSEELLREKLAPKSLRKQRRRSTKIASVA